MPANIHLLLIDPQNDFCDLPEAWLPAHGPDGGPVHPSLPVSGAHADMMRVGGFIDHHADQLSAISVSLDTHHSLDVAHPGFWLDADGRHPSPFTQITAKEMRDGRYRPRQTDANDRVLAYLDALEDRGRYTLMVWPVHCELGSWGHGVHDAVRGAYNRWELSTGRSVAKLMKGMNRWTENYSLFEAEVPDPDDPATQMNTALLAELDLADLIVVAGEASSHCVGASLRHLIAGLPGERPERITVLTDAMSPVGGFEPQHAALLGELADIGVQLTTTAEWVAP